MKDAIDYFKKFYSPAKDVKDKWFNLLDWPRSQSPILPLHHNFPAYGLEKYLKTAELDFEIKYLEVKQGEDVLSDHVCELASGCELLVSELSKHLDKLLERIDLWQEVKNLSTSLKKPHPKDPIRYEDFYNPMKIIYDLTVLFLSGASYDTVHFGESYTLQEKRAKAIIAPSSYWNTFKNCIRDYDVVVFSVGTTVFTKEEMLNLLNSKYVKVMITVDTQPYWGVSSGSFKDIFYAKDTLLSSYYDDTKPMISCARTHFGGYTYSALIDYDILFSDKLPETKLWCWNSEHTDRGFSYLYYSKGHIIEVPYDGSWKNTTQLDLTLSFLPCSGEETFPYNTVFWFSGTKTDTPSWHQYPTVVDTFKALFGPENVAVYS